jgi:lyso-ornithine lipid O-acyltransferase
MKRVCILLLLIIHLFIGVLMTFVLSIPRRLKIISLKHYLTLGKWWHSRLLSIFRVRVIYQGDAEKAAPMMVSNHISWLDIVVIGAQVRTCFVSKAEVRKWPVIGFLASSAGTLFIKRGSGDSAQVAKTMQSRLLQGGHILFFPEGTTTDGSGTKSFYPRLFAPAIDEGIEITPMTLIYHHDELPHPTVPFVDDQSFFANLITLIDHKGWIEVTMVQHENIKVDNENRKQLALRCKNIIDTSIEAYQSC